MWSIKYIMIHICKDLGVPIMAQSKRIWLVSLRMQVQSLASLSRWKILSCRELWCRLAAEALIQPLAWEPPYVQVCPYKKRQKKKKKVGYKAICNMIYFSFLQMWHVQIPGPGLNFGHSSSNSGSLTHWAMRELQHDSIFIIIYDNGVYVCIRISREIDFWLMPYNFNVIPWIFLNLKIV